MSQSAKTAIGGMTAVITERGEKDKIPGTQIEYEYLIIHQAILYNFSLEN
mgnify:CR=1 FL=1